MIKSRVGAVLGCMVLICALTARASAQTPDLLFEQAKRLFDQLNYDQALPLLDKVIAQLLAATPQRPDLITQGYEMRARARFAQGDPQGAEQDFSALLAVAPGHKLGPGISPRVVAVFENVRKITIGRLLLSVTPPGEVLLDGRKITLPNTEVMTLDLPAGEHTISHARTGYREINQRVTVTAGQETPVALTLERIAATLTVITVPSGVEVLFDGASRGTTQRGEGGTDMSAPMLLADVQPGNHRLLLRRECHRDLEHAVNVDKADDFRLEPLKLTPSMASVKVTSTEPASTIYVDGASRGGAPADLTVCEGAHVIEVRGTKGRFLDRREWKAGDAVTLAADLRPAYAIVAASGTSKPAMDRVRLSIERALQPARRLMLYMPSDADLDGAVGSDEKPSDWLLTDMLAAAGTPARYPRDTKRDLARKLAGRLGVSGLAVVSAAESNPNLVTVWLLASGSGEPDRVVVDLADPASRGRAVEFLSSTLPPLVRPSLETSFVDLPGVQGAVVVRPAGAGARAGLASGDIVVSAGGTPIASVAELRARVAAVRGTALDLPLDVQGAGGQVRKAAAQVAIVPDTIPMRDPSVSYNRALLELRDQVDGATAPTAAAAVRLNLAITHMRLGNWEDALTALESTKLPDGPGVSAGTVAYLTGLSLDALGRSADAAAAYKRAASSPDARLSYEGPLVAPLAQQKLKR
jgi:tetratricopeptide (TPR) repeat protein